MDLLTLSQSHLLTFLTCKRRFQLRYLEKLSWPISPLNPQQAAAIEQGRKFHQLIERFLLGLPISEHDIAHHQMGMWWAHFKQNVLPLPKGRSLPELGLTIPIGGHFLIGRFDLVIISGGNDNPSIHIFDWKTSWPRPTVELRNDWQSKLYLAMMAESNTAVFGGSGTPRPAQIRLTYWYVNDPQAPRTMTYSSEQHMQNWAEIEMLVAEIDSGQKEGHFPLTENWGKCRSCDYGSYCGRIEDGVPERILTEERAIYEFESLPFLEPESP